MYALFVWWIPHFSEKAIGEFHSENVFIANLNRIKMNIGSYL